MNKQIQEHLRQQMAREQTLHLYAEALDRGDFAFMEKVMDLACQDETLTDMILSWHRSYDQAEQELASVQSYFLTDTALQARPALIAKKMRILNQGGNRGGH